MAGIIDNTPDFGPDWALFLDVDGTLLDLADKPDAVIIKPKLLHILKNLTRQLNGAVAFISGRALSDLDRLFDPLLLPAAGAHGLQRRSADQSMHYHPVPDGMFDEMKNALAYFAEKHAGVLIEDKGNNVAVHYRMAPEHERAVETLLKSWLNKMSDDFILQRGKMMLEIRPGGKDKGTAIDEFMQEDPFAGRRAVFIGDDITDELGFAMVNNHDGHSIKVGEGDSAASWRLSDSNSVLDWLEMYIKFMRRQGNA